jgi:DNA-directed RNA polymerase specialized sigma24 family protein
LTTTVTLTGTGVPYPDAGRAGAGTLVRQGQTALRFDAGRATVLRLAEAGILPGPECGDALVAVTDLFRDHHIELVRLALIMVGDLATAEDVVQDAFERLHRGWHNLRQPSSGLAYLRSCVLNGCRSVHRRAAVARRLGPRLAGPQEEGSLGVLHTVTQKYVTPGNNGAARQAAASAARTLPHGNRPSRCWCPGRKWK